MPRFAESIIPATEDQYDVLSSWLRQSCIPSTRLLDIGAGNGDVDYPERLKPHIAQLVGVDPDPGIGDNRYLDAAHCMPLERFAADNDDRFDQALAVYVLEHVTAPVDFLRSVATCLEPGGSLFGVTPNLWHYFGLSARAAAALGAEAWLLHRLRGHELTSEYHFPVRFSLNSGRALRRHAAAAGFREVEIRYLDDPGVFVHYFPKRFRAVPALYSSAVYRIGKPALLGTLIFKLTT